MPKNVSAKYDLNITPEIIARAQRANSHACLIAEAMKEVGLIHVMVDLQTCRGTDPTTGKRYCWLTPRRAQLALVDFDQGVPSTPFKVRLSAAQIVSIRKRKEKIKPAQLVQPRSSGTQPNATPVIREGRLPPRIRNMRREYGIRGLHRDPFEQE